MDIDWADIIDTFASEYGWTIEYINTLDLGQIVSLRNAIKKRYQDKNGDNIPDSSITEDTSSPDEFFSTLEKSGAKRTIRKDGTVELTL